MLALGNREYRQAAEELAEFFGGEAEAARAQAARVENPGPWDMQLLFEEIEAGRQDSLHEFPQYSGNPSMDFRGVRLDDLTDDIVNGQPTVVHELAYGAWGSREPGRNNEIAAHIAGLLGRAKLLQGRRPLTVSPAIPEHAQRETHAAHATTLGALLLEQGLSADNISYADTNTSDLLHSLEDSPQGIITRKGGVMRFDLTRELSDQVRRTHPHIPHYVNAGSSIVLQGKNGWPTLPVILASRLDPRAEASSTNLVLADDRSFADGTLRETTTLLAALGRDLKREPHAFRHSPVISPKVVYYAFARALQTNMQETLEAMERFRDSGTEPGWVERYVRRNYGEEAIGKSEWDILPEDVGLTKFLVQTLPECIPPGSIRSYRNIGSGPYSYLNALFRPFMAPGALMRAQDFSQEARDFATAWKEGRLPAEFQHMGPNFEQLMVAAGGLANGHLWRGGDKSTREMITIEPGDLFALDGEHEVEADAFTCYATSRSKSDYWGSIAHRAERSTGWVITLDFIGAKPWGEKGEFSAVSLDEDDPPQAHRDGGLEVVAYTVIRDEKAKARPGYEAMACTVARKRPR